MNDKIKAAFTEFMITKMRVPRITVDSYWELFWESLKWRLGENKYTNKKGYNNCVFVKIPKTATTSINEIVKQFAGHRTAKVWREKVPEYGKLFTFSIVRNPYTRFVSAYHHAEIKQDINVFLKEKGVEGAVEINETLFRPQYKFVCDGDTIIVDYLGRFEELDKSWEYISKKIGATEKLTHEYKAKEKSELNKESKEIVYKYYKKDFELFKYKK